MKSSREQRAITPRWQRLGFSMLAAPPGAARRLDGARGWRSDSGWSPRRLGLARLPLRRGPAVTPTGARRVAVHRMRDGRLAARARIAHGRGARCDGRHLRHPGALGSMLRRAAHPRRTPRRRRSSWRCQRHGIDARRGPDPRQLRRLRCGAEGLRPPARHRRRAPVRGTRARRPRVDRPASRSRCPSTDAARQAGDRAGPVPPAARAEGPPAGANAWSVAIADGGRARRRRVCAVAPAAPTRRCNPSSPARSGNASSLPSTEPSRDPGRGCWSAPTRAAACICSRRSPSVACGSAIRSTCSPRRCRE